MSPSPGILVILAKYPAPGLVKTRIAKDSSPEEAARIQRLLLQYILGIHKHQTYRLFVGVRQPEYLEQFTKEFALSQEQVFLQKGNGLGEIMEHAITYGLQREKKVILMGSDIPGVSPDNIHEGFFMLDNYDIILGPTVDGGYRSLGTATPIVSYLSGITYSTESVFDETIDLFEGLGKSIGTLPIKMDIDTRDDRLQVRERFEM